MVKPVRPVTAGRIKELVRQTEKASHVGATGYTLLRFAHSASPVSRLVERRLIGPEEYQAAHDLSSAFLSMAGALMVRGQTWERIDKGMDSNEPAAVVDAQRRYRAFARHWSMRRGWGDHTLQILIATVVDERPFYIVDADIGLRNGKAKQATIRGLRDYAVRAGWIKGRLGDRWTLEASNTFPRAMHPDLMAAIVRAKRAI